MTSKASSPEQYVKELPPERKEPVNLLREAIIKTLGFTDVKAVSQNESSSMTYHFMHERIQDAVFDRMFKA